LKLILMTGIMVLRVWDLQVLNALFVKTVRELFFFGLVGVFVCVMSAGSIWLRGILEVVFVVAPARWRIRDCMFRDCK
jgi:hypothetical protein